MVRQDGAAVSNPVKRVSHLSGSTFWLVKKDVKAPDAAAECAKSGGRLAVLNTQRKIDFVTTHVLVNKESAWIGAHCINCKKVNDEKWFWVSGDQLFVHNKMWKKYNGRQTPYDTT